MPGFSKLLSRLFGRSGHAKDGTPQLPSTKTQQPTSTQGWDRAAPPSTPLKPRSRPLAPPSCLPVPQRNGTALVPLTNGKHAVIDAESIQKVHHRCWIVDGHGYAKDITFKKGIQMHRLILPPVDGYVVDHANGDRLDNRRTNLRHATRAENSRNAKLSSSNTSGYRGVIWVKREHRWVARIRYGGKSNHLGTFRTAEEAAHAYDAAARREHGRFACVNFPRGEERPARDPKPSPRTSRPPAPRRATGGVGGRDDY